MTHALIIGTGGHAGVIIDAIRARHNQTVLRGLVDDFLRVGDTRHGLTVLGRVDDVPELVRGFPVKVNVFVAVGDNAGRASIVTRLSSFALSYTVVRHPTAIANTLNVGDGTFLAAGSIAGNNTHIGCHCILNTNASLDHDSTMGDFSHLAPGVVTGGRVTIGHGVFVGAGACIRDGITIGDHSIVGMGSVVTRDVPANTLAYGNPCRHIRTL